MQLQNLDDVLSLRAHTQKDLPFMQSLYASTREQELAMTNFNSQEKQHFILQQFSAQYMHYTEQYCTDSFNIIEFMGEPIGRFFIEYRSDDIRIVDITIIPERRNQGIATYLFNTLFSRAKKSNQSVSIHVEHNNPAKNLYERLGFKVKSKTNDIYLLMEWKH